MSNKAVEALKRNSIADYLKVGDKWERMNKGFTKLDENPNAQKDTATYIGDVTSSSSIEGYQTEFPYDSHVIVSQKAVMALYYTGRNHDTGSDAEFEYLRVDLFMPVADQSDGEESYLARKFIVSNEVSSFSGEGGKKVTVSGNLSAVGDFVAGKFDLKTLEFTEGDFSVATE